MGEISYARGHNDNCRKRFMELSETPGHQDLKSKFNKSMEKATRKWLETKDTEEETSSKKSKVQDDRSQSKQASAQSSGSRSTRREKQYKTRRTRTDRDKTHFIKSSTHRD